jgi:putative PEP-CTERM system integral membrane protein
MKNVLHAIFHGIFWLWNVTFLYIVYGAVLPFIGILLIPGVLAGEIETEFLLALLGMVAVPTICTWIGVWKFRQRPLELMRLFYGIEAPFFLLFIIRLFVLRELTPASNLVLGTAIACFCAFFVELLWGYQGQQTNPKLRLFSWVQVAAHSLMLLVGLYVGVLLLFYAVPSAAVLIVGFFSFTWVQYIVFAPVFLIFFFVTGTLFLAMPSALAALYVHSGQRILRAFSSQYGRNLTATISLGVITAWIALFMGLQNQPQVQAFELLKNPPKTEAERQELLDKSDQIRAGLTNAYLASYRYVSTWGESNQIRVMYQSTFGLPEPILEGLQTSFNQLMSPFLYQGDRNDDQKAGKLYAQFFDTSIQKGERLAIQHALKSTAILDDAKAGVLNINQEKVWLKKQAVTVKENGDWADVELYEVYNNKTADVEEIFYSFSLPESATITGIWLGDTDNRAKRFPFTVSPRGAAQKVYTSQVRRERPVDPALLEQVGPRQYRLRAFPIPPKPTTWEGQNPSNRPTEMHLWLTYKVMRQDNGWQLPSLGEKRNIFWTNNTERFRNGQKVKGFDSDWLEATLPTSNQPPKLHQASLNGYQITAKPLSQHSYNLPQGKRFAVVLDTSRSMEDHRQALAETFKWLGQNVLTKNDADLYVAAFGNPEFVDDIRKFDVQKKTFYGTLQLPDMLRQFGQLRDNKIYDAILLISDRGSYELAGNNKNMPRFTTPLWAIHLGHLPPAYDDNTLKAIQDTGGGVSTSLAEVLQRIATTETLAKAIPTQETEAGKIKQNLVSVVDGYAWYVEPTKATTTDKKFEPLAARILVQALSKQTDRKQVKQLDAIHAIAKTAKIVTPYSSMIVLVNDEQRQALKAAEASADRFNRKVEDGKEQLNKPNNPLAAASVPEPSMMVGLGAIAIFLVAKRKR